MRKATKSRHVTTPDTLRSLNSSKLGTKFIHIPTNRVFILRAITDPKTLEPTRYLWCKDTEKEHFEINPTEWKKA